jgi:hypothetical protein
MCSHFELRPSVAQDRLSLTTDGQVRLELRRPWSDGTTHLLFDPIELLERLAVITPRPRINLILYHGVLAPRAAWRAQGVEHDPSRDVSGAASTKAATAEGDHRPVGPPRPGASRWAARARGCGVHPDELPRRGRLLRCQLRRATPDGARHLRADQEVQVHSPGASRAERFHASSLDFQKGSALGPDEAVEEGRAGAAMNAAAATKKALRFVTSKTAEVELAPWGKHWWLSRPELTSTEMLTLVRVTMRPGAGHQFHYHPTREEIIYVVEGVAEQWVDREKRRLKGARSRSSPRRSCTRFTTRRRRR